MMAIHAGCRRKYLRMLAAMVITLGIIGYIIPNSSQQLMSLYSGVVMETREIRRDGVPGKLKLLSYKGMPANQTNAQSSHNQLSSITDKQGMYRVRFEIIHINCSN